jgi:Mg-chelatase subunit ChlD
MKTMICLILDRSGSMAGREADVIGGVNTFLDEQKKLPDPASLAMVRFDTGGVERFRPMQALAEVKPLTAEDYQPRGGTPLLDAIGKTLAELDNDWKAEQPERAILVIVTDGQENESREYKKAQIKEMIESRQASGKWAIVYLGANVDAFAEGASMGIAMANSAGYQNTARGTKAVYAAMSESVTNTRITGATLSANLGRNISDDEAEAKPASAPTPPPAPQWSAPKSGGAWTPPA